MTRLKLLPVDEPPGVIRAAVYLRMSTDMQVHSIDHQLAAITTFAEREGLTITQTYADPGRSGLTLKGRPALRSLLEDVERGPEFEVLLVYDVSRWGRFQDNDESAYYEFQCRRAGVRVVYCAEPFENDGSPMGAVFKSIKRAMASEYSRELSAKISSAQRRLSAMGYWQGAPAGYGLVRQVVDAAGRVRGVLQAGETKSVREHRTRLVPGDPREVAVVRRIFKLYCGGMVRSEIAKVLNTAGVPSPTGIRWCDPTIRTILMNSKYAGHYVYGRKTQSLRSRVRSASEQEWLRADDVFGPIIPQRTFDHAQRIGLARSGKMTDEQMLGRLRVLLKAHGKLTVAIIKADAETPSYATYTKRFGSALNAYDRVGWTMAQRYRNLAAVNAALAPLRTSFNAAKRQALAAGLPPPVWQTQSSRGLARAAAKARRAERLGD